MLRRAVLVSLIAACACTEPYDPFDGAEPFQPPAIYKDWWVTVEACSGTTGDFSAVRWYTKEMLRSPTNVATSDYVLQSVVLTPAVVMDAMAVRHEMLHLLIRVPGHPPEYFNSRCGAFVEQ